MTFSPVQRERNIHKDFVKLILGIIAIPFHSAYYLYKFLNAYKEMSIDIHTQNLGNHVSTLPPIDRGPCKFFFPCQVLWSPFCLLFVWPHRIVNPLTHDSCLRYVLRIKFSDSLYCIFYPKKFSVVSWLFCVYFFTIFFLTSVLLIRSVHGIPSILLQNLIYLASSFIFINDEIVQHSLPHKRIDIT